MILVNYFSFLILETVMSTIETIGVEEVAAIRTKSVTCPVMIVGRNRTGRHETMVVGMTTVPEVAAAAVAVAAGTTIETVGVKTIGRCRCREIRNLKWNYLVAGTRVLTLANMKTYPSRLPVKTSRVTLHLYVHFH